MIAKVEIIISKDKKLTVDLPVSRKCKGMKLLETIDSRVHDWMDPIEWDSWNLIDITENHPKV